MSTFKGTSTEQDSRYADKHKKLIASIKFPSNFDKKVDLSKVNMDFMRSWITKRIYELLGFEDEVIPEYVFGILEESNSPDPKSMQVLLTGFLEDKTPLFMKELWRLLLSAQESLGGIPAVFVEIKKEEIRQKNLETEKLQDKLHRERGRYESEDTKVRSTGRSESERYEKKDNEKKYDRTIAESRKSRSRSRSRVRRDRRSRSRSRDRMRDRRSDPRGDDRRRIERRDDRDYDRRNSDGRRRSRSRSRSRDRHRRNRSRSRSRSRDRQRRNRSRSRSMSVGRRRSRPDDSKKYRRDRSRSRSRTRSRSPYKSRRLDRSRSRNRGRDRQRDSKPTTRSSSSVSSHKDRSLGKTSQSRRVDRRGSGDSDLSYEQQLKSKVKESLSSRQ